MLVLIRRVSFGIGQDGGHLLLLDLRDRPAVYADDLQRHARVLLRLPKQKLLDAAMTRPHRAACKHEGCSTVMPLRCWRVGF